MKVSDILAAKGSRVVTVWPSKPLDRILRLFDERSIASAVVVDAEGRPLGIVTDRGALRQIARRGAEALELEASQVMEAPVPGCAPDTRVTEAMLMMTDRRVRHLVVMDGGRIAGIVSIGDLVKSRLEDAELESRVLREMALGQLAAE